MLIDLSVVTTTEIKFWTRYHIYIICQIK
jgi:hypothetical protein